MSYGAAAYPPIWKNIIGYDRPSTIRPYAKRPNADELALSLRDKLKEGLVLYLPFVRFISHRADTITKVFDRSPYNNHGTIYGAVWQTLPSGKSALSFDGVDDYVEVADSDVFNITNYTVMAWIYPYSLASGAGHGANWLNKDQYFAIVTFREGSVEVRTRDSTGTWIGLQSLTKITTNKWWFIAYTVTEDGTMKLYINGNKDNECTFPPPPTPPSDNLYIGTGFANPDYVVNGTIDEVRIYNRVLSEEEINRLFELTRVFYGV